MKEKLITEFIGTFFLYLIIALSAVANFAGDFSPLVIGVGLCALIYTSGHRSFAHFNPIVSLAFLINKKQTKTHMSLYIIVAFLGSTSAALLAMFLEPTVYQEHCNQYELTKALLAEFIFTFILVWVILNVAISKNLSNNGFYGLSIGFIVSSGIYCVESISAASFNPAMSIGLYINNVISLNLVISYTVIQIIASIFASLLFKYLEK